MLDKIKMKETANLKILLSIICCIDVLQPTGHTGWETSLLTALSAPAESTYVGLHFHCLRPPVVHDSNSETEELRQDVTCISVHILITFNRLTRSGNTFASIIRFLCRDMRWKRADAHYIVNFFVSKSFE